MVFKKILSRPLEAETTAELVQQEVQRLVSHCSPEAIFLFGSARHGLMTTASDLDVLVVLPDGCDVGAAKTRYYRSARQNTVPVDVLFFTQTEFDRRSKLGGICFVVAEEGALIYSKNAKTDGGWRGWKIQSLQ